jgi:hypothetical protein
MYSNKLLREKRNGKSVLIIPSQAGKRDISAVIGVLN